MQVIASLRRRTKSGISTWNFCYEAETNQHFAVGGENLKVITCEDRAHLRTVFNNFKRYGYKTELPKKQMLVADPWQSELPLDMQHQLAALA